MPFLASVLEKPNHYCHLLTEKSQEKTEFLLPAGETKLKVSLQSLQVPCRIICGIARTLTWYLVPFWRCCMSILKTMWSDDEMFWTCDQSGWEVQSPLNIFKGLYNWSDPTDITISTFAFQMTIWNSWFSTFRYSLRYGVWTWMRTFLDSWVKVTLNTRGLLGLTAATQQRI